MPRDGLVEILHTHLSVELWFAQPAGSGSGHRRDQLYSKIGRTGLNAVKFAAAFPAAMT